MRLDKEVGPKAVFGTDSVKNSGTNEREPSRGCLWVGEGGPPMQVNVKTWCSHSDGKVALRLMRKFFMTPWAF